MHCTFRIRSTLSCNLTRFGMADTVNLISKPPDNAIMSTSDETSDSSISSRGPALAIEKDDLIEKLQNVPEDVLRSILTNQVDLEIRLKHKELKLTEEEIGKCEAQVLALRKFLEVPNELSFRNEPNDFTLKYFDVLNKSLSVNYTKLQQLQYAKEHPVFKEAMFAESEPVTHSYRTRSTTSSLRPAMGRPAVRIAGCLYRRTDGVIVKMTCPDCQRSNFSSAQGFLNHSRIAHSKEYASQDSAALRCGEVLPDEFQDEEGLPSLASMRQRNINSSENLHVTDGYFGLGASSSEQDGLTSAYTHLDNNVKSTSKRSTPESTRRTGSEAEEVKAIVRNSMIGGVGTQKLMKKLISNGVARDAKDFEDLMGEIQKEIPNAHLFADEEETEEDTKEIVKEEKTDTINLEAREGQSSESHPPRCTDSTSRHAGDILQAGTNDSDADTKASDTQARAVLGRKYANRLRRRKSRADMSLAGAEVKEEDGDKARRVEGRRTTKKKAQR